MGLEFGSAPSSDSHLLGVGVDSIEALYRNRLFANALLGGDSLGDSLITSTPIPMKGAGNCQLGAAYQPGTGCGGPNQSPPLIMPSPCPTTPATTTQACQGNIVPEGDDVAGYAKRTTVVIASSSDFSTSVHAAAKASASGYGIEASGAMSQVTQGDLSTQSGGVYLQAYSN